MKRRGCPCAVCGYRFNPGDVFAAFFTVALPAGKRGSPYKRNPRWPHRKQAGVLCPECGTHMVLVTVLCRDELEFA